MSKSHCADVARLHSQKRKRTTSPINASVARTVKAIPTLRLLSLTMRFGGNILSPAHRLPLIPDKRAARDCSILNPWTGWCGRFGRRRPQACAGIGFGGRGCTARARSPRGSSGALEKQKCRKPDDGVWSVPLSSGENHGAIQHCFRRGAHGRSGSAARASVRPPYPAPLFARNLLRSSRRCPRPNDASCLLASRRGSGIGHTGRLGLPAQVFAAVRCGPEVCLQARRQGRRAGTPVGPQAEFRHLGPRGERAVCG
jgi:hypothetical protein